MRLVRKIRYIYVAFKANFVIVIDASIPTVDTGVPNTDTGHCQKMINIFELLIREIVASPALSSDIQWIMLADDDTLLG